jgi:hypothetical protein
LLEYKKGNRQHTKEKAPQIKKDTYSKLLVVVAEGRDEADVDVDE